jgi:sugar porter (SP) family MFS transporter
MDSGPDVVKRAALYAWLITIGGGFMFGYATGYVPVCLQYYTYLNNCTRYVQEPACAAVSGCSWAPPVNRTALNQTNPPRSNQSKCLFDDRAAVAPCTFYSTYGRDTCDDQSGCYWDADANLCEHSTGWDAVQQGLIATTMIIGAMFGSIAAGQIINRVGRRRSVMFAGLVGVIGGIMQTVAWQKDAYGTLLASRIILGLSIGLGSVVSPLYCSEVAPRHLANVLGVFFQISITFGIVIAAIIGVLSSPANDTTENDHLVTRFHAMNAVGIFSSVAYIAQGFFVPEPTPELRETIDRASAAVTGTDYSAANLIKADDEEDRHVQQTGADGHAGYPGESAAAVSKCRLLIRPLAVGVAMSCALQLTGINAIMNYAPKMTQRAGMNPLVGNVLIMIWNFLFTIVSIPLAKKFEPRKTFIISTFVASLACLLTGIPTYPGVIDNEAAQHACIWIGLLLFVAVFEIGVGPPFYPISTAVFPAEYRNFGVSFCLMAQFALNCVINFGFPVGVEGLSGGESGNQNKGQALMFIIFGCIGIAVVIFLAKFM